MAKGKNGASNAGGPKTKSVESDVDEMDWEIPYDQKLQIIRSVSNAPEDPKSFHKTLSNCLPFAANYKQLMAIFHPDKFGQDDKEEAQKAFQSNCSVLTRVDSC